MQIGSLVFRANWKQISLYVFGILVALQPWTQEHTWGDLMELKHFTEVLRVALGVLIGSAARSFIGRQEWTGPERVSKTLIEGKDTSPSK